MTKLAVYVKTGKSKDSVIEYRSGELVVTVKARPIEGKANRAVCKLVAKSAGLPVSAVQLLRGAKSQHKLLAVDGVDKDKLLKRLTAGF